MSNEIISIKRVLTTVIGEARSEKYMQKPDANFFDGNSIYQAALTHLLSGKTEKAIIHIIYGLDLDRTNMQLLHLCKTMLLSISEYLFENNTEVYRQKYPDLYKADIDLSKNVRESEKLVELTERKLKVATSDLRDSKPTFFSVNKFFITYFFKKRRLIKEIDQLEENLSFYNDEFSDIKKTIKHISPLVKVDEYSKILGLIIEICTFPTRYEWILSKK
ncbi:MAG: hypothetical protein H7263_18275 [Candidatus Sericytochromatia bacterium]|nr:hypothetical protein [Candidatus Sericytochromatia bacterium]